jgi:predicted RNA methylase
LEDRLSRHAEAIRESIIQGKVSISEFRAALLDVPYVERDAWVDAIFQLDGCGEDTPELPQGCVPYLPCAVTALLQIAEKAPVTAADVFVDIGSGAGRAAVLMHLLTGASSLGIEIQATHLQTARELVKRLCLSKVTFVQGDAAEISPAYAEATVFFLYCPFSGVRLERFLNQIEALAQERAISICTVDLPLPEIRWLDLCFSNDEDVRIYRSRNVSSLSLPK